MSWLKTRPEGEAQGEYGGHQSPSTAGAAQMGAVPNHPRKSLMVEAWLHTRWVIFLLQSWEVQQQQPKSYDGSIIVGEEFDGRLTQPTPGAAGMLCHHHQNALTEIAGAGRVTRSRQR